MRKQTRFIAVVALVYVVWSGSGRLFSAEGTDSRLDPKLEAALNAQVNAELHSAYLYLSMAAYFESVDLQGFANWMRVQYQEETTHGLKFFDYINQRNGRVKLTQIEAPPTAWKSPLEVFRQAYEHEKLISKSIANLVMKSRQLGDTSTETFLQWFVTEQVEEEGQTYRIAQQLKLAGEERTALLLLDREFAKRKPPAAAAPAPAAGAPPGAVP
jgi:ferritin